MAILLGHVLSVDTLAQGQDCNTNGQDDALDLADSSSPDCNTNNVPDECELATPIRFEAPVNITVGLAADGLVPADMDGDGLTDLVVFARQPGTVRPLLNQGQTEFEPSQAVTLDGTPQKA
ncbi:MAG: hypothetical protein ACE5GE_10660, partial [Phycisphaerae bacterium]